MLQCLAWPPVILNPCGMPFLIEITREAYEDKRLDRRVVVHGQRLKCRHLRLGLAKVNTCTSLFYLCFWYDDVLILSLQDGANISEDVFIKEVSSSFHSVLATLLLFKTLFRFLSPTFSVNFRLYCLCSDQRKRQGTFGMSWYTTPPYVSFVSSFPELYSVDLPSIQFWLCLQNHPFFTGNPHFPAKDLLSVYSATTAGTSP